MPKFLFAAWPFSGHLHPDIAIGHVLKEAGHQVAFYTGATASAKIEGEGFDIFPFKRLDEQRVLRLVFSQNTVPSLIKNPFALIAIYRGWLLETVPHQVEDLEHILRNWCPDVVVPDPTFWGPILVLHETKKIPVAISSFIPGCMIPGPDAPPWGLGLPSPRGFHRRIIARIVEAITDRLTAHFRRDVNELRRQYGLSPMPSSVNAFTARMPLYLIPGVPELDYNRHDLPPSVHYVGPCVWNKPHTEPPPKWMAEIPRDRPLIHVTEGTMHSQAPFVLQAAAQGLADLHMQVIMTTGGDRNPEELHIGRIAHNIRIERWVPHDDLLPLTDVMVTTGGGSTVLAGLNAGVPMVLVPTQWDKPDNAQRVVEAGAGIRLSPRRCTPARLRTAVEKVLSEPSFLQNARRMATIFKQYGGASKAAELLTSLCN